MDQQTADRIARALERIAEALESNEPWPVRVSELSGTIAGE
jgi:hypothetical protein